MAGSKAIVSVHNDRGTYKTLASREDGDVVVTVWAGVDHGVHGRHTLQLSLQSDGRYVIKEFLGGGDREACLVAEGCLTIDPGF